MKLKGNHAWQSRNQNYIAHFGRDAMNFEGVWMPVNKKTMC